MYKIRTIVVQFTRRHNYVHLLIRRHCRTLTTFASDLFTAGFVSLSFLKADVDLCHAPSMEILILMLHRHQGVPHPAKDIPG